MNVVFLGAGNVNTILGRLCKINNHNIIQVYNRTLEHAETLGNELKAKAINNPDAIVNTADIYIISVSDNALKDLISNFHFPSDSMVVHTTGAASINILQSCSKNIGVLYPLQSIRKEREGLPEIPFFIDANNEHNKNILYQFANTLSSKVSYADDEKRMKLHIAAVIASNFTNHLYAQAETFCDKEDIPFSFLTPLIEETALRLRNNVPSKMQTGPAIRKDSITINKHIALLDKYPKLQALYRYITESIQSF